MKTLHHSLATSTALLLLAALALFGPGVAKSAAAEASKIRVLLVYGGHDFQTNQFLQFFKANPDITFDAVEHPNAHARLRPDAARQYDVLVVYDMWQKITDEAKADLVNFFKSGKGMVSLHHSIANYQNWPEYEKIIGGRYYLDKTMVNGVQKERSTWKHDVDFKVQVVDGGHPITRGVKDFQIHDETYGKFDMAPESHLLLATEEPTSARTLAWAKTYEGARIAYIQLGHDQLAYKNPNYSRLVANAIRWAAKKD